MFILRYIGGRKYFKFFGPIYKCYKVHEIHDDETYIFCYRWDYKRWDWIREKDMRPILWTDSIFKSIFWSVVTLFIIVSLFNL